MIVENVHASNNTPTLRFPEFSGEWEEKKLQDVVKFRRGGVLSKSDIVADGSFECIHYGELFTEYAEVIHEVISRTDVNTNVDSEIGDILMPTSDVTPQGLAKASTILIEGVKIGGDVNILKPNSSTDSIFLSYLLNFEKKKIMRIVSGTTVRHVYSSDLAKITYYIPTEVEEQQKTASFLTAVDARIAGMAKKVELLKKYKKGVMHKIFAQEIRFKDENGKDYPEWEEKRLGEVAYSETSPLSANEIEGKSGRYKVYGASGELQTLDTYHYEEEYIAIVKDGAGVGRISYCDPKSSVLGTMIVVQPKGKVDKKFLYYLLHQVDFKKYTTGSTIPHVYFRQYSKEEFGTPSITEQQKIAAFLTAIDDKIALEERRLQQAKWFKKSLLQQMFV